MKRTFAGVLGLLVIAGQAQAAATQSKYGAYLANPVNLAASPSYVGADTGPASGPTALKIAPTALGHFYYASAGGVIAGGSFGSGLSFNSVSGLLTSSSAGLTGLTGDVTAAGTGSQSATLATVNGNVGTFGSATVAAIPTFNAKGLTTGVTTALITPAWSSITAKPTTLGGYGITDAAPATSGTTLLAGNGSGGFTSITLGTGLTRVANTLSASGAGTPGGTNGQVQFNSGGTFAGLSYGALRSQVNAAANWVTKRPPSPTDDSNAAYATGQFWQYNGEIWQSQYVGAGKANWQPIKPSGAYLCDQIACQAAYAVYPLKKAYAGAAFQLKRNSDSTTQDIGFVNGWADFASADNFCLGTTCGVSIWYDQSGNGYNLTQATFANMPSSNMTVYSTDTVKGKRSITFNGGGNTGAVQSLANTAVPFTDLRNFSILFVGRQYLAAPANQGLIYQAGNGTAKCYVYNGDMTDGLQKIGLQYACGSNGAAVFSNFSFTTPEVLLSVMNAGAISITQNDLVGTSSGVSYGSTTAATGINLGATSTNTAPAMMEATAFVVFNSALSTANQQLALQSSYVSSGIQPQIRDQMVMAGSSLLVGGGTGAAQYPQGIFPAQLSATFDRPFNQINLGRSGITSAQLASVVPTYIAARAYLSGAKNFQITDGVGSNDFSSSSSMTASTVCGYYTTIGSAFKGAGFITADSTILPRTGLFSGGATSSSFETGRLAFNASLLAGTCDTNASAYVDPGGDPTIGPQSATSNTSLFFTDNTHTTVPLGASYIAASWERGLSGLLQ